MTREVIAIGKWAVEFYFADEKYDTELILDRLYDFGASSALMRDIMDFMDSGDMNTGFTFANPYAYVALIAIGPSTSGDEFINTLVHEIHHLAVAIATELGVDLDGERPAYIAGDASMSLARAICRLGCSNCND